MIGCDLDGTLTKNWAVGKWANAEIWMQALPRDPELVREMQTLLCELVPIMLPTRPVHIITSRAAKYFKDTTIKWLKMFDVNIIQLHMAMGVYLGEERILYKAHTINELGLHYYFEDEEEIRGRLMFLCPDTCILPPEEALRMGLAKRMYVQ